MANKKLLPATKIKTLPVVSDSNLSAYLNFVNTLPMLSLEQEQELARCYKYKKDLDAAQQLVLSHLRFVTKIARNFSGYGLSIADLIQEGNIGLMKAVSKFDPDQGVRLVSFAVHWIKAEMHDYVLKNWKIVKVATTKAQRKLFFNLRSSKGKVGWLSSEDIKELAEELSVKEETVIEMEKRMCQGDASLDLPYTDDDGEQTLLQSLYLEDKSSNIEHQIIQQDYYNNFKVVVKDVLSGFDTRTKNIIISRYLLDNKATLQDLAAKYNISAERVRQIEEDALAKLKKAIKTHS
ncbi:MAG: RNA polymerase sigma factor RpoH [Francisella endosymbiont of Hyalomma asiaticum]